MRSLHILKSFLLALLFVCLTTTFSFGVISQSGSCATNQSAVKSLTLNHTLNSGTNRVVLIFVTFKDSTVSWLNNVLQVLSSSSNSTIELFNGNYSQSNQFRVRYDSGGDNIDAELLYNVDFLNTVDNHLGFTAVFAVWEADLPTTTGSKTVFIDSSSSASILSHVGVIQYNNVLQNVWYADSTQSAPTGDGVAVETSITLNFNTQVANCVLLNAVVVNDQGESETNLIDNSSQTSEVSYTFDDVEDLSGGIFSKTLSNTGDDFVNYTLSEGRTFAVVGIILIPDSFSLEATNAIRAQTWNVDVNNIGSFADPNVSATLSAGSDRIVLGFLYWDDTSSYTINTATFGGQSMTHLGQAGNTTGDTYVSAWYLLEEDLPLDGNQNFTVNNPSNIDNWVVSVVILENVEQEAPNDFNSLAPTSATDNFSLSALVPNREHSWIFSLWGLGDNEETAYTYSGMVIYNLVNADTAEMSQLNAGPVAHDRSITVTQHTGADELAAALGFWVRPIEVINPRRVIMSKKNN